MRLRVLLCLGVLTGCGPSYLDWNLDAFDIDRTEVTVEAYAECVRAGACEKPRDASFGEDWRACNWGVAGHEHYPLNCVSWPQATQFCEWKGKHLPSGPEWLLAAFGTDERTHPWGFRDAGESDVCLHRAGGCEVGTHPRDQSPYGAMDMEGGVAEWTASSNADLHPGDHTDIHVVLGGPNIHPRVGMAQEVFDGSVGHDVDVQARTDIGFRCAK
jgi:formylglycine-generating enzyme required for sulfatase activity